MTYPPSNWSSYTAANPWTDPSDGSKWRYEEPRWFPVLPASSGGTTLTSYADQIETLADYPETFPADHAAATVSGNGITISGQQISLSIGSGSTQVAAGNHSHTLLDSATDAATPDTLAKRDASGEITFSGISITNGTETVPPVIRSGIGVGGSADTLLIVSAGNIATTANDDGIPNALHNGIISGSLAIGADTKPKAVTALTAVTDTASPSIQLVAADSGKILRCTASSGASNVAVTMPTSDPGDGFSVLLIQAGTLQIVTAGGTRNGYGGATKTAGQHACMSIIRVASSTYNLSGNLTT